jgi:hypothetical protein
MVRFAQESARPEGFEPGLYVQPMHELDLPRQYRTIYMCGALGLGGDRANDLECFRKCHRHLLPGGALVFNTQMEYTSRESWDAWLSESRRKLPEPWPDRGPPRIAKDGSHHFMQIRVLDVDALNQTYTREVHLEKWEADKLIAAENYVLRGNLYLNQELLLMLEVAGFMEVIVRSANTDKELTTDHEELVFTAVR